MTEGNPGEQQPQNSQIPPIPPQLQGRNGLIALGIIAFFIFGLIFFFFSQSGKKDLGKFTPLLQGITQDRAVEIEGQLRARGFEVERESGTQGDTINVREKQLDSAILEISESSLLNEEGFHLFDSTDWAASEFERHVKYERAISGELTRLISRMKGIKWARVRVSIPRNKVFTSKKNREEPSAGVTLELEPGYIVPSSQVQSIVNLVQAYVRDLSKNKISIVDTGNRYYSGVSSSEESFHQHGDLSAYQTEASNSIQSRIQSLMNRIVGEGNSEVVVSTLLSHEKTKRNKTFFFPGAVKSQEYQEEALGKASLDQVYRGEVNNSNFNLQAPAPKDLDHLDYYPDSEDQQSEEYYCSDHDNNGACKRNYRRHNFSLNNYPSYEQVFSEEQPGTIEKVKVSIVLRPGSFQGSLGELKRAVAGAASPSTDPREDVEIILGENLPEIEETSLKSTKPTLKKKISSVFKEKKVPWWLWLIIIPVLLILILIVLNVIIYIFQVFGSAIGNLTQNNNSNRFNQNNRQKQNSNFPFSPEEEPPNLNQNPTQDNSQIEPKDQSKTEEEIPFDLGDEFENKTNSLPSQNQNTSERTRTNRPKIIIDDDE